MRPLIIQASTSQLPLPDNSVDLIVTSPPYWGLRDYRSDGETLEGQLGREDTWQEYIASLTRCTAEWARVLKPSGSMFVNLGDRYGTSAPGGPVGQGSLTAAVRDGYIGTKGQVVPKGLCGLPWRYAFSVADNLGLTLRAEIIWAKPNGLPESVRDRVVRKHEQIFHFTQQESYYQATDLLRSGTPHQGTTYDERKAGGEPPRLGEQHRKGWGNLQGDPLGSMPVSWWVIPTEPLQVPPWWEGDEHYAAFPPAIPRKCITGWCPPAICTVCGKGLFPVVRRATTGRDNNQAERKVQRVCGFNSREWVALKAALGGDRIEGFACDCTPYTVHEGRAKGGVAARLEAGENPLRVDPGNAPRSLRQTREARAAAIGGGYRNGMSGGLQGPAGEPGRSWREYHLEGWEPPPTRPAVVLDPFGGTGTTALVAVALGRRGISVDLSRGYCDFARWRANDPGEQAAVRGERRPPRAERVRDDLYGDLSADLDRLIEEAELG